MNKEFQHEIRMICKASHTNVVKLKGLCLETKVPLLVCEFISNSSLFDHIHTVCSTILNSWKTRLRIAFETALALDYLHSKAGTPIIHRDVKSMNILLDQNFTVKVADFGSSVLIPLEQGVVQTKVLGTHGYLDPEYLITGILTVKSDVYSFGVVLMELLTSQMPISNQRSSEKVNFITYFISTMEKGNLGDVLNVGGFDDRDKEMEQVEVVAELVVRCLNRSGIFRPDMNEVVEGLLRLMKLNDSNGGVGDQSNIEEMLSLLSYHNDVQIVSSSFETQYMTSLDIQQAPFCNVDYGDISITVSVGPKFLGLPTRCIQSKIDGVIDEDGEGDKRFLDTDQKSEPVFGTALKFGFGFDSSLISEQVYPELAMKTALVLLRVLDDIEFFNKATLYPPRSKEADNIQ
ncbi:hypothetical protein LguiA_033670 [Lonicera macranthoides]